jgi:hypothetical protein
MSDQADKRENTLADIMADPITRIEDLEAEIDFDCVNIDSFDFAMGNISNIAGDYSGAVEFRNTSDHDLVIDEGALEEMLGQAYDAGAEDKSDGPALTDDQRHLVHRNVVALLNECIVITTIGGKLSITSAQSIADEVRNALTDND